MLFKMLAEFEVEIGPDQPRLGVPWQEETGALHFVDLASNASLVDHIPESRDTAMRTALLALNRDRSHYSTAKCDLWTTEDLDEEEREMFGAAWKHACYIDVLFADACRRASYEECEQRMRSWMPHLRALDVEDASVSIILRQCDVRLGAERVTHGFYWTIYVTGFAETGLAARDAWATALLLTVEVIANR